MYPGKQAVLRSHVTLFGVVGSPLGQSRFFTQDRLAVYRGRPDWLLLRDGFGFHRSRFWWYSTHALGTILNPPRVLL